MKFRIRQLIQLMKTAVLGLSLLGCTIPLAFGQAGFTGGSGTPEDPHLIATSAQLNNVRNNLEAHYKQIANINLAGYASGEG